jgi:hypothetical protein
MTTTNPPAGQVGSCRVGDLDLNRIGYGAMQLAGPHRDRRTRMGTDTLTPSSRHSPNCSGRA